MFGFLKRPLQGFTLIEVVVALGLSLVTLGAVYTLYVRELKAQHLREDLLEMQQRVRVVMDVMGREVLMAGYDPARINRDGNLQNDFLGVTYDPDRLIIKADLNGNGTLRDAHESIMYMYDAKTKTLRRNTGGGNQPFVEHIESFSLQFLDKKGMGTTDSTAIRTIAFSVRARTEHPDPSYPKNRGYRTLTLYSRVTPRNLQS